MNIYKSAIACTLISCVLFFSCKKEENNVSPQTPTQALSIHCHSKLAGKTIVAGQSLSDSLGRQFKFDVFRFYLSNITLIKADKSEVKINKSILITEVADDIQLGTIPAAEYVSVRFTVGLDSITNHSDISARPSGDALGIQNPAMHWSWNSGYIFLKVEGRVDSTAAGNSQPNKSFLFHIGLDKNAKVLSKSISAPAGGLALELHTNIDYAKLFAGLVLNKSLQTHSMDNQNLSTQIINNLSAAFSVHAEVAMP